MISSDMENVGASGSSENAVKSRTATYYQVEILFPWRR